MLSFLPDHMHQAVVAATITPTKMLEACLNDNSLPFIKARTAVPAAPPTILSLSISTPEDSTMQGQAWQEAASELAEALQKHSGLTRLDLELLRTDATSAQLLARCTSTLKSLQSLYIGTCVDSGTYITLQHTLEALPQLQTLSLDFGTGPESLEREHDARIAGISHVCLASVFSPATSLTSLFISATAHSSRERFAFFLQHTLCSYHTFASWKCMVSPLTRMWKRPTQTIAHS